MKRVAAIREQQAKVSNAWVALNRAAQARDKNAYHAAFTLITELESQLELLERRTP